MCWISQLTHRPRAKSNHRVGVSLRWKPWLRYFAYAPPIFTGEKCEIWPRLSPQSSLRRSGMKQHLISKRCAESANDCSISSPIKFDTGDSSNYEKWGSKTTHENRTAIVNRHYLNRALADHVEMFWPNLAYSAHSLLRSMSRWVLP